MQRPYFLFLSLIIICAFTACIRGVNLDDIAEKRLVIEGQIWQNQPAIIKLSESISKTAEGAFPTVEHAIVELKTNELTEQLVHQMNGIYHSQQILGKFGQTYQLTIHLADEVYHATSTLPYPMIQMDSLTHQFSSTTNPSISKVTLFFQDTSHTPSYGLVKLSIDEANQDSTILFQKEVFAPSTPQTIFWENAPFSLGTTLQATFFMVEPQIFEYFEALETLKQKISIGGLTIGPPENLEGNIDNGALGYFGAMVKDTCLIIVE